jgi:hypothetical protein
MPTALQKMDAKLARLDAERERIQRLPLSVPERFAAVERRLHAAEQHYRNHGSTKARRTPPRPSALPGRALIGAMMVAGGAALLKAERARIEKAERARIEQAGEGLSTAEKACRGQAHLASRGSAA